MFYFVVAHKIGGFHDPDREWQKKCRVYNFFCHSHKYARLPFPARCAIMLHMLEEEG